MTNARFRIVIILMAAFMLPLHAAHGEQPAAENVPPDVITARAITKTFQERLKAELQAAMKQDGPVAAIGVCHSRAPEVAAELGAETGWKVARTSLKTRNSANAPTKAEKQVMEEFERARADGIALATLEWWDADENGFSYMKAIPAQGMCMTCHGENIAPKLREKLDTLYPEDTATGFSPGDIRGAFTLYKPAR